jgi:hypothetical protein
MPADIEIKSLRRIDPRLSRWCNARNKVRSSCSPPHGSHLPLQVHGLCHDLGDRTDQTERALVPHGWAVVAG